MSININRYVSITSSVGGTTVVPTRLLIARLFTENELVPPRTNLQFFNTDEVKNYFGSSSEEYARSVSYFSFITKGVPRSPQAISFSRWVSADVAPMIFGYADPNNPQAVSNYTAISTGSFSMTIGSTTNSFTGIDFTGATTLAGIATILQTKIRTASGAMWTSATVTFNSTTGAFDFVGGVTGGSPLTAISVQAGSTGVDISGLIGWYPAATVVNGVLTAGALFSQGADAEEPADCFANSISVNNNFGSFTFMPALTLSQHIAVAELNKLQNVLFMYQVAVTAANAAAWSDPTTGLGLIGGTGLTLLASGVSDEYPEQLPMSNLAATDYTAQNSVSNYEFLQAILTPSVTDDSTADAMDALRINYYGQTQTAGQQISFYQRGVLMGTADDPLDMNVYANEQWLKDAAAAAMMNLLISLTRIPANSTGIAYITSALQSVINQGLFNGTISVGKQLSQTQILFINQITGDTNAYHAVQSNGYWLRVVIVPVGSPVTYQARYLLVYSKDDDVRKIEGSHLLI